MRLVNEMEDLFLLTNKKEKSNNIPKPIVILSKLVDGGQLSSSLFSIKESKFLKHRLVTCTSSS